MDFLGAHLVPDDFPLDTNLLYEEVMTIEVQKECEMYFDEVSKSSTGEKQEDSPNNKIGIM